VVPCSDNQVAEELLIDPRVDMVSFTGSTGVGKRIMEKGAATLKRVFLELGGKSAHIVLDDADFATTLPYASGMCMHAGQGCVLLTRLLVQESRYDEAVELVANAFRDVTYGDPTDPKNMMGPLVSARQRDRVLGYIQKGVDEGARLVVGGHRPAHLPRGYYVEPTVFADVTNDMTIAREEIFGPVICVMSYRDEEDAIRIANDSDYGLGAAVTSPDLDRALNVARRLRAGALTVNGGVWYGADSPYGGYKTSGVGRPERHRGLRAVPSRPRPSPSASDRPGTTRSPTARPSAMSRHLRSRGQARGRRGSGSRSRCACTAATRWPTPSRRSSGRPRAGYEPSGPPPRRRRTPGRRHEPLRHRTAPARTCSPLAGADPGVEPALPRRPWREDQPRARPSSRQTTASSSGSASGATTSRSMTTEVSSKPRDVRSATRRRVLSATPSTSARNRPASTAAAHGEHREHVRSRCEQSPAHR